MRVPARACHVELKARRLQRRRLTDCVAALEVGQLVKDDYFTLFESIGAIEVLYIRIHGMVLY